MEAPMEAANDNNLTGATVRTPEEHRAIVAGITGRWRTVDAWPVRTSLRKRDPQLAVALEGYADAMAPYQPVAANDNQDDDGGEDFSDVEFRHEIRPTVGELIMAANGDTVATAQHSHGDKDHRLNVTTYSLGNTVFDERCRLTSYQAKSGRWFAPRELQRGPRGEDKVERDPEDDRHLLRSDAVIARGAYFFAGKVRSSGTARQAANDNVASAAVVEAERCAVRSLIRTRLGEKVVVLDAAITDETAREIGEQMGFQGKHAERRAMEAITVALDEFQKVTA